MIGVALGRFFRAPWRRLDQAKADVVLSGADVGLVRPLAQLDLGQGGEGGVDHRGHRPLVGQDEGRAPGQLRVVDPGQVEGDPAAGAGLGQLFVVALDVADPGPLAAGQDHDLGVEGQGAAGHGARSRPCRRPWRRRPGRPTAGAVPGRTASGAEASMASRATRSSSRPRPERESTARTSVGVKESACARRSSTSRRASSSRSSSTRSALRDHGQAVGDAEQVEDPEVLLALGHPPLGGRHHQDRRLHGADPGQHVLEEPDVARHVDEPQLLPRRQRGEGEPEVDRQPPGLLLRPPVRIRPRQRQDERRLAVVDVPRRGYDPHQPSFWRLGLTAVKPVRWWPTAA